MCVVQICMYINKYIYIYIYIYMYRVNPNSHVRSPHAGCWASSVAPLYIYIDLCICAYRCIYIDTELYIYTSFDRSIYLSICISWASTCINSTIFTGEPDPPSRSPHAGRWASYLIHLSIYLSVYPRYTYLYICIHTNRVKPLIRQREI